MDVSEPCEAFGTFADARSHQFWAYPAVQHQFGAFDPLRVIHTVHTGCDKLYRAFDDLLPSRLYA